MYHPPSLPDTQALTDFRENTAAVLKKLADSNRPLLITQKGKAAGVIMSPRAYEALADAAELARSVEQVRLSIAQFEAGLVEPADKAFAKLEAKYRRRVGKAPK